MCNELLEVVLIGVMATDMFAASVTNIALVDRLTNHMRMSFNQLQRVILDYK